MGWVKSDDKLRTHPKVLAAGPLAGWLWYCARLYAAEHLTDGFVPEAAVPTLTTIPVAELPGLLARLLTPPPMFRVGLFEPAEGGYHVHDYLDYNPTARAERRRRTQGGRRVQAWRRRQREGNAVTRPDGNGSRNADVTPTPSPSPFPSPSRKTKKRLPEGARTPLAGGSDRPEPTFRGGAPNRVGETTEAILARWRSRAAQDGSDRGPS